MPVSRANRWGGASETSLGSRLMQAGVQLVLAMGYSVTVSAANCSCARSTATLCRARAFDGDRRARHELYNRKERRAYYNQIIDLEDWLLPVVYQNQAQLEVRPFTPEESKAYMKGKHSRYAPPQPSYGFVGRDLDILQIEKRLSPAQHPAGSRYGRRGQNDALAAPGELVADHRLGPAGLLLWLR